MLLAWNCSIQWHKLIFALLSGKIFFLWILFLFLPSGYVPIWVPKATQLAEHGDISHSAGFSFPLICWPAMPGRVGHTLCLPAWWHQGFWKVVPETILGKTDSSFILFFFFYSLFLDFPHCPVCFQVTELWPFIRHAAHGGVRDTAGRQGQHGEPQCWQSSRHHRLELMLIHICAGEKISL